VSIRIETEWEDEEDSSRSVSSDCSFVGKDSIKIVDDDSTAYGIFPNSEAMTCADYLMSTVFSKLYSGGLPGLNFINASIFVSRFLDSIDSGQDAFWEMVDNVSSGGLISGIRHKSSFVRWIRHPSNYPKSLRKKKTGKDSSTDPNGANQQGETP
jgi:hypothetical protein